MKRSWLIGAALLLSLSAVACSDDNDGPTTPPDGGPKDGGPATHMDGGMDGGPSGSMDASMDAGPMGHDAGDAGDAH